MVITNKIRKICNYLIPPIFSLFYHKMRRVELCESPLQTPTKKTKRLIIIGNGPSLTQSLEKYKSNILESDRMAANYFAASDYYLDVKPNYYVFADPMFFKDESEIGPAIHRLLDIIILKTNWPIMMIVPICANMSYFVQSLKKNTNITLNFFNSTNQDIRGMSKFDAWDKNFLSPPCINVLNVSVYLSIFWRYAEVFLIGADTSFISNLRVDQTNNKLYSIEEHFYSNTDVYKDDSYLDKTERRYIPEHLHEELGCIKECLYNYVELSQYAISRGVNVYNASEYSWIDAFERKKLC